MYGSPGPRWPRHWPTPASTAARLGEEGVDERALADARLAREHHRGAPPRAGPRQRRAQPREQRLAARGGAGGTGGRAGLGRAAPPRQQAGILLEDAPLQPPRGLPGLQAQLAQLRRERAVGGQRVDLAAGGVERQHQPADELLAQRLALHQALEVGHGLPGAAERHERGRAALLGPAVELLEPPDLVLGELGAGQLGVGRPAPQGERAVVGLERGRGRAVGGAADLLLEAQGVDLARPDGEPVAVALAHEQRRGRPALAPRLQERAEVGDPHAQRARGGLALDALPGRLEQRVGRHRMARVDEQPRQDRPLLGAWRGAGEAGADDLDPAEDVKAR